MKTENAEKAYNLPKIFVFLWAGAILVNIKSIFTDFNVDAVYALVTAYRNLMGDRMFVQMLEPHQTSAFLPEIFIWIFFKITGSPEGIVIWLQVIGVSIFACLTYVLYRVLIRRLSPELTNLICIFLFTVRPKQLVFPDFSNMLILFSTLVFCFMIKLYDNPDNNFYVIMISLCLCLGILSYPSFIIAYPFVVFLFILCRRNKLKNILKFSAGCFIFGAAYVFYFCRSLGIKGFFNSLMQIASGDSSHLNVNFSLFTYTKSVLTGIIWIGICFILTRILARKSLKGYFFIIFGILLNISHIFLFIYCGAKFETWNNPWSFVYSVMYLLMIILGIPGIYKCSESEKYIYITGMTLSTASFISVIMLTNQSLVTILPYLILAVMVSFIPFSKDSVLKNWFLILFCILMMSQRFMAIKDYYTCEGSFTDIRNIIREGPAKGIVCSYMGYYQSMADYNDCMQYLHEDDSLLLVSENNLNSIMYIYMPLEISHYSTICTSTYDENLLEYWNKFPEKLPTVIAVECWYGDLSVSEDSWIMEWIEENYSSCQNGSFWRFYRQSSDSSAF